MNDKEKLLYIMAGSKAMREEVKAILDEEYARLESRFDSIVYVDADADCSTVLMALDQRMTEVRKIIGMIEDL